MMAAGLGLKAIGSLEEARRRRAQALSAGFARQAAGYAGMANIQRGARSALS